MSLWFRRRDQAGRLHLYSVHVPLLVVLSTIGVLVALLLPVLHAVRVWLRG